MKKVIPEGTRDYTIEECFKRNKIIEKIKNIFRLWGYREVSTPTIEYFDNFNSKTKTLKEEEMYKFFDNRGHILVLRPDMTVPVARMVATKLKDLETPMKLSYCSSIFRVHESFLGGRNEYLDCGVELIGVKDKIGDLEIITTAIETLKNVHASLKLRLDVTDRKSIEEAVKHTINQFGKIDILVNNAGILDHRTAAIDSVKDEDINAVIDINAKGTIYFTREVAKVMAEQKSGAIVNTASVAGVVGNGGAAYVASKGAVIALTKNVALRMASIGVRCNAVCPGTVNTPMTSSDNLKNLDMNMLGAIMAHMDKNVPICQPEDVANTILFLASDEAKAITGQIIVTDFGATL